MIDSLALSILLLAFFASVTFNGFFRNIADKNNILIDIPDKSRKFHFRATPLTGGLGIFFGIIVAGILLTGLSGANYSLDFTNKGFVDNSQFNNVQMSRNFEVNDKNYELSLNKNEDNKVSVEISSNELSNEGSNNVVDVIYLAENKFKAVLPDGREKLYP